MRRRLTHLVSFVIVALAVFLHPARARANQSASGFCEAGAQVVVTSGLTSTTQVQASYPQCQVQVLVHGGSTALIFDDSGNALANPFTATTTGQWLFTAANGHYDVLLSGGGMPFPVTIVDVLLNDPAAPSTLVSPTITNPTITGTVAGGATYTLPLFTSPTTTGTDIGIETLNNKSLVSPTVTGTVAGGASYTGPTITNPSVTGTVTGGASYTAPTLTSPTITGTVAGGASYTAPTLTSPVVTGTESGNRTDSGNVTQSGNLTQTGTNTTGLLNSSCYVDGTKYVSIAAAYAGACASNATIYVPSNQTIAAGIAISTAGVSIVCLNNAQLTLTASAAMFTITGGRFSISGCILDGGSLAQIILSLSAADAIVEKNVFQNFGVGASANGDAISVGTASAKNIIIYHNKFVANAGSAFPIIVQTGPTNILVDGNTIDMTNITTTNVNGIHFQSAGTAIAQIKIINNDITVGGSTTTDEGIVVEANGTGQPTDVTLANNRVKMVAAAGGCYTVADTKNFTITGNRCDLGGFNMNSAGGSGAGIETASTSSVLNGCADGVVSGNTVVNASGIIAVGGIDSLGCSNVAYTGNAITEYTNGSSAPAIFAQTFTNQLNENYNTFTGNTISAGGATVAIELSANVMSSFVLDNTITGNTIENVNGTASSVGIELLYGAGTMTFNSVGANSINNVDVGIKVTASATNSLIQNNMISNFVTSAYSDAGTGTRIIDNIGVAFTALTSSGNGSSVYCTTCLKASNPCSGSSTGTFADRINGAWVCR